MRTAALTLALCLSLVHGLSPAPGLAQVGIPPGDPHGVLRPDSHFRLVLDRMGDGWMGKDWVDVPTTPHPIHPRAGDTWTVYGGVELAFVPAGSARVGGRRIRIRRGFWIGRVETTQLAWRNIMRSNPSSTLDPARPVDRVSCDDARRFCMRLSMRAHGNASDYPRDVRLPTTLEWDYALRDGSPYGLRHLPGNAAEWVADPDGGPALLRGDPAPGNDSLDGVGVRVFFREY